MKYSGCFSIFLILVASLFLFSIYVISYNKPEGFFNSKLWTTAMQQRSELDTYDYRAKKIHRTLPSYNRYCSKRPSHVEATGFVIDPLKSSNDFYNKELTIDSPSYKQWLKYKNKEKDFWIPPANGVCPKGCEWDVDNTWRCTANNVEHAEYCNPTDKTSCYGCDVCNSL